jgi:hypothetical protein
MAEENDSSSSSRISFKSSYLLVISGKKPPIWSTRVGTRRALVRDVRPAGQGGRLDFAQGIRRLALVRHVRLPRPFDASFDASCAFSNSAWSKVKPASSAMRSVKSTGSTAESACSRRTSSRPRRPARLRSRDPTSGACTTRDLGEEAAHLVDEGRHERREEGADGDAKLFADVASAAVLHGQARQGRRRRNRHGVPRRR